MVVPGDSVSLFKVSDVIAKWVIVRGLNYILPFYLNCEFFKNSSLITKKKKTIVLKK